MKQQKQQINQLIRLKKIAYNQGLNKLIIDQQSIFPTPNYTINEIISSQYAISLQTITQNQTYLLTTKHPNKLKNSSNKNKQPFTRKQITPISTPLSTPQPIPITFAYFNIFTSNPQHYHRAIMLLKSIIQKQSPQNLFILNYNLACLYNKNKDYKKAIFYLESTLKEKPFFEEAIIMYIKLLGENNREKQAVELVKRHLMGNNNNNNIHNNNTLCCLSQNSILQSLLIKLASLNRSLISQQQLCRLLHNKSLPLPTYYNLGLYYKKSLNYLKSSSIFTLILSKMQSKKTYPHNKSSSMKTINLSYKQFLNKSQDIQLYFLCKINLLQIYLLQSQNNSISKQQQNVYYNKAFQIISSILTIKQMKLIEIFRQKYQKYSEAIKNKRNYILEQIKKYQKYQYQCKIKLQQQQQQIKQKLLKQKQSNNNNNKQSINNLFVKIQQKKRLITQQDYQFNQNNQKQNYYHQNNQTSRTNNINKGHKKNLSYDKQSMQIIQQFNKKYINKRIQHQKKMKFLLLKDKQLDNFFTNLPKLNNNTNNNTTTNNNIDNYNKPIQSIQSSNPNNLKSQKLQDKQKKQNKSHLHNQFSINKSFSHSIHNHININNHTLITRLRQQLKQKQLLNKYQQEYQKKKIKYQKQFEGYDLDNALEKVMNSIFNQNNNHNHRNNYNSKNNTNNKNINKNLFKKQLNLVHNNKNKIENGKIYKKNQKNNNSNINKNNNFLKNLFTQRKSQQKQSNIYGGISFRIKNNININKKHKGRYHKSQQNINPLIEPTGDKICNQINTNITNKFINNNNNTQKNIDGSHNAHTKTCIFSQNIQNIQDIFGSFNHKNLSKKSSNIQSSYLIPTATPLHLLTHSKKNSSDILDDQLGSINKLLSTKNLKNYNKQQKQQQKYPTQFTTQFNKANIQTIQGDYKSAYKILTKLYKTFKHNDLKQIILLSLAKNLQLQGQYDDAEKTYLKCLKYHNPSAFINLGVLQIKRNRINSGIQNLQKANCLKRFDKQIQTKLVYAYSLTQQTTKKALSLANSILQRDPLSIDVLIMTAKILQDQGKIKQSLQICLAIDNHKQSQIIKHYIGILYLSDSNIIQAFKFFKNSLSINSSYVPSLIEIGTILSELKPKEAIFIMNKALEIQPNNRLALTRLAKIYQTIQVDHEKAVEIYRKTLETKQNYQAYMKIGDCLVKNDNHLQAFVNYKQALNLKKTYQVYQNIAKIHQHNTQYKKAIQFFQLSLSIIPNSQHKHFQHKKQIIKSLARNLILILQYSKAITYLQQLLQMQQSKQIYLMMGQSYFGKSEFTQALEYYQKAYDQQQEDLEVLEFIALCFDKKQQYSASKLIYEKILSIQPKNLKCINNYANILLILGNMNEAFYWYEKLVHFAPNNMQKRLKLADIYYSVGDWSKVQYHLQYCYKKQQHDTGVLDRLIKLYKEKRQAKLVTKYQKKLQFVNNHKKK